MRVCYARLWAVTNCNRLLVAPAEAGALADLRGYAAPVGSQAFCSRMMRWTSAVIHVYWANLNWKPTRAPGLRAVALDFGDNLIDGVVERYAASR